jgi:hypothetical protein
VLEGRTLDGLAGTPAILIKFSDDSPGKCRENTSIRPGSFLFETFTVHSSGLPAAECIIKISSLQKGTKNRFSGEMYIFESFLRKVFWY